MYRVILNWKIVPFDTYSKALAFNRISMEVQSIKRLEVIIQIIKKMKINFTKEHEEKLDKFIVKMWKNDIVVTGKLGQPLNICELKTLSPNQFK